MLDNSATTVEETDPAEAVLQGADGAQGTEAAPESTPSAPPEGSSGTPATDSAAVSTGKDRGDGRDSTGKFAPRGTDQGSTEGAQATPPADPAVTAPPPATATTPADATVGNATDGAKAPEVPAVVRYNNVDYPVGKVTADGTVIGNDLWPQVRELIGQGLKLQESRDTFKREQLQLRQEAATVSAKAKAFDGVALELDRISQLADDEEFAKAAILLAMDYRQSRPLLERQIELDARQAKLDLAEQMRAPDPEQRRAEIDASIKETYDWHLTQLRQDPQSKILTDKDFDALKVKAERDPTRYFYRTGAQLTPKEQAAGAQPHELVFDSDRWFSDVQERLELRQEFLARELELKRTAEAQQKNAARLAQPTAPPPLANGNGSAPAARSAPPSGVTVSREDYLKEMGLLH